MKKIFIIIVGYNHKKYLQSCVESAFRQSYKNFSMLYVDNASTDGSIELMQEYLGKLSDFKILENKENFGYSQGYNQGINYAIKRGVEFVMCLTPDIVLEPNFLAEILKVFEQDEIIGAVTGKLLKLSSRLEKRKVLDSTGIVLKRDRSAVDRGEGEEDTGQYDEDKEIFGVSGAAPLYRVKMIQAVAYQNNQGENLEFIDNKFFAYKDDVDLGYRMQWAGWKARYAPMAIAYHERVVGRGKGSVLQKKEQGSFAKYLSFRNSLWLLFKNESPINLISDSPFIIFRQLKILGYCLFFEPKLLKAFWHGILGLPYCLKMRKFQLKKSGAKDFRKKWL